MILLFESNATEFDTNGLGTLPDATYCVVTEERNGEYELEMDYPVEGLRYSQLALRRIILAKPNTYSQPQPFRIYSISKPINGVVTINAEHISYDLSGYSVKPFSASSCALALQGLKLNSVTDFPFTFWTDKSVSGDFDVITPKSIRSLLGGSEGSILDVYGKADYEFDRFEVKLHQNRGTDRGMVIYYGKNLTDLKQEENCSNVYTHVYPFWCTEEEGLVQLTNQLVQCPGTYNFTRILPLDCSNEFQEKPTQDDLLEYASSYISSNNLGVPDVNLTVSFVQLSQTEEYKNLQIFEDVRLCDYVTVEFSKLGVSAKAKCIKTNYNVLSKKYDSIELGEVQRSTLSSTIVNTIHDSNMIRDEIPSKSELQLAGEKATKMILSGLGGYVVIHSSSGDYLHPDEILVMDNENISQAIKVWRWNKNGLGFSNTGYDGTYSLAMTADGQIVADKITVGQLNGALIKAGSLLADKITAGKIQSKNGYVFFDLDNDLLACSSIQGGKLHNSIQAKIGNIYVDNTGVYNGLLVMNKNYPDDLAVISPGENGKKPVFSGSDNGVIVNSHVKPTTTNVGGNVGISTTKDGFLHLHGGSPGTPSDDEIKSYVENSNLSYATGLHVGSIIVCPNQIKTSSGSYKAYGSIYLCGNTKTRYIEAMGLTVSGEKNRIVKTENYEDRLLYSYETPTPYFGDIGEGTIGEDGLCYIYIDPIFSQTVENNYRVFIQSYGKDSVVIKEKTDAYFAVKGIPNTDFAWEIKAIQKGYETIRLEKNVYTDYEMMVEDYGSYRPDQIDYGIDGEKYYTEYMEEQIS